MPTAGRRRGELMAVEMHHDGSDGRGSAFPISTVPPSRTPTPTRAACRSSCSACRATNIPKSKGGGDAGFAYAARPFGFSVGARPNHREAHPRRVRHR